MNPGAVGLEEVLPNIELPVGVVGVLLAGSGVGDVGVVVVVVLLLAGNGVVDGGGVVDGLLAGGGVGEGGRRCRSGVVTATEQPPEQAPQANWVLRKPPRLPEALERAGHLLLDLDLGATLPLEQRPAQLPRRRGKLLPRAGRRHAPGTVKTSPTLLPLPLSSSLSFSFSLWRGGGGGGG